MSGGHMSRLNQFQSENERLRRAVADLALDKQIPAEGGPKRLVAPWRQQSHLDHALLGISIPNDARSLGVVNYRLENRDVA